MSQYDPQQKLDFNSYQEEAKKTAIYGRSIASFIATLGIPDEQNRVKLYNLLCLCYSTLGMVGEAGEVAGKVKKIIRDNQGIITEENKKDLGKETGDVQWYNAATASDLNLSLESIAKDNLSKLQSRSDRGVLGGSGDNR